MTLSDQEVQRLQFGLKKDVKNESEVIYRIWNRTFLCKRFKIS